MQALVSLVIPVYNQKEEYFRRCLESALVQQHQGLEIIVSDNHSSNGCTAFLSDIADPRLRVIKPPCHLQLIQHFAFAGFHANGRYVSFLPSDDWLEDDWLEVMLAVVEQHPDAAFAYCDLYRHDIETGVAERYRGDGYASRHFSNTEAIHNFGRFICKDTSAYMVGALIRSDAYFASGGFHDAGVRYAGDACMGLGLLKYGGVVYHNQALANYTVWSAKQGKSDAQWSAMACQDIAKVLSWAKSDVALRAVAHDAGFSFARSRIRMSVFFLLAYIKNVIDDSDNTRIHDDFQQTLKILSRGWFPIWMTSLFRIPVVRTLMAGLKDRFGKSVRSRFL
ncbi:MAG: glycosyltransferase family 2 protein [Gammaproteobacteria bacterium]|nr:glycosyltransferase family 2 protein [Gammaproteobacteria bacterium]